MAGIASKENGKKGGRPKGATSRPSILEFWDNNDLDEFFTHIKENYKKDARLATWVGDHILGKAPQALTGPNGEALVISFDPTFGGAAR